MHRRPSTIVLTAVLATAAMAAAPAITPTATAPTGATVPMEQDDAGTGRDAGDSFATAIPVDRGVEYDATLLPAGGGLRTGGDDDWFTFQATAGESITIQLLDDSLANGGNCLDVLDEQGEEVATAGCGDTASFVAPATGTYAASFGYFAVVPHTYRFVIDPGPAVDFTSAGRGLRPDPGTPTVVVAVADSGVNPYHDAYRRPHLTVHPCQWVVGFDDCSIPALPLSIGVYDTYEEAFDADRTVWASVEVGQWYWIPGTNIIGAVCDGSINLSGDVGEPSADAPCIHDENGHGTGATSSVLTEAPNALLLVHEGNAGASALEYAPVVPDIQSHSWGPAGPLPLHAADPVLRSLLDRGFSDPGSFDPATLFFIAAGNEAPFPSIIDSSRVHPSVQIVGGGFPGKGTGSSWSMYDFASWFCRPTATPDSIDAVRPSYCGTSFSAPTVAGTAAAALLELRTAEGYLGRSTASHVTPSVTRDDFVQALRDAATYDAEQRYSNTDSGLPTDFPLLEGQEHLVWGYGWLDATRIGTIVSCVTGGDCPTKSEDARRWNQTRQQLRHAQTDPLVS